MPSRKEIESFHNFAGKVAESYKKDKAYMNNNEMLIADLVKNLMEGFYDAGMFRNCCNCDNWNEKAETCQAAGGKRPPAKVIVVGCELHSAVIPF